MPIILDGTAGVTNNATDLNYTGTLTGGTGVVNLGSGQVVKDASGNVGIGTSSPTYKLDVQSTTNALARVKTNTTGFALLDIDSSASDQAILRFLANGVEQARILSTANDAASNLVFARGTGSTESMRIDSSGGLILVGSTAQKATGTTWSNPSDQRLKNNIRDYDKGIDELMQVRVREWEYNGKGGTVAGTKGLGVVADEVMVVLPDTVENYEAKLNADDKEVTDFKKFDATEITWLLVKTVQELKAIVDTQAARITALEAK